MNDTHHAVHVMPHGHIATSSHQNAHSAIMIAVVVGVGVIIVMLIIMFWYVWDSFGNVNEKLDKVSSDLILFRGSSGGSGFTGATGATGPPGGEAVVPTLSASVSGAAVLSPVPVLVGNVTSIVMNNSTTRAGTVVLSVSAVTLVAQSITVLYATGATYPTSSVPIVTITHQSSTPTFAGQIEIVSSSSTGFTFNVPAGLLAGTHRIGYQTYSITP